MYMTQANVVNGGRNLIDRANCTEGTTKNDQATIYVN